MINRVTVLPPQRAVKPQRFGVHDAASVTGAKLVMDALVMGLPMGVGMGIGMQLWQCLGQLKSHLAKKLHLTT